MSSHRWMKFWPQDYASDPALRCCSLSAQALWMRLICLAFESEQYGHVLVSGVSPSPAQLSRIVGGVTETDVRDMLEELETARVFSRTRKGVIFSRRMVRDAAASEAGRKAATKRWSQAPDKTEENGGPKRVPVRGPNTLEAESEAEAKLAGTRESRARDAVREASDELFGEIMTGASPPEPVRSDKRDAAHSPARSIPPDKRVEGWEAVCALADIDPKMQVQGSHIVRVRRRCDPPYTRDGSPEAQAWNRCSELLHQRDPRPAPRMPGLSRRIPGLESQWAAEGRRRTARTKPPHRLQVQEMVGDALPALGGFYDGPPGGR